MSVSINPPKTPVTKGSKGVASATMPNVCKMPGPPAPFVLTALPNLGRSGSSPKGYTKHVKVGGQPVAIRGSSFKSKGDAASKGTGGGLVSSNTHGPTTFAGPGSRNVKFEGKNVQLLGDPMLNNCNPAGRLPNSATMVGVVQESGVIALVGDEVCALCGKEHGKAAQLQETADTKADANTYTEAAQRAAQTISTMHAWEQDVIQQSRRARAREDLKKRKGKLKKQLQGAMDGGHDAAVAKLEKLLANLEAEEPESVVVEAGLTTMLGIAHCADGQIFAGNSSIQRKELINEMPRNWHTTAVSPSAYDACDRKREYQKHFADAAQFTEKWKELEAITRKYDGGELGEMEGPYYEPGQCAAPKVVALALEHGARPVGLTERYFKSSNPDATVEVCFRVAPDAPVQKGEFGGKCAVPPCSSCEVLLTMLMCERALECQHRPPAAGVCRCT